MSIRALLFDLDGVFHVGDQLLPGAVEAVELLRARRVPFRIVTNTTTRSRASLIEKLRRLGLPLEPGDLINAPYAAVLYLRSRGPIRCRLVVADDAYAEFAGVVVDDKHPDVIVLGDVEDQMNYTLLNDLFNQMMAGAELVALHKGRFWQVPEGLKVDLGVFVAGLEYTTGKSATIIGKPSPTIFRLALEEMGVAPKDAVMIGDDLHNDVGGAQGAGIRGVLIRTGKYRSGYEHSGEITADAVIDSLDDLSSLLG
jgi:HAD superfamily hydrolase (TIGR01458 family)